MFSSLYTRINILRTQVAWTQALFEYMVAVATSRLISWFVPRAVVYTPENDSQQIKKIEKPKHGNLQNIENSLESVSVFEGSARSVLSLSLSTTTATFRAYRSFVVHRDATCRTILETL